MSNPQHRSTRPAQSSGGDEEIRNRAYQIYESRRREGVPGDPVADWLRAEAEIRRRAERGAA